jgi:hypothetical protein
MTATVRRIAAFITPHGYGHASRACAVLLAIREIEPAVHFEIFTQTPLWFFNTTLGTGFTYHDLLTDIGLVQDSVMDENLPETIRRLQNLLPPDDNLVKRLAAQLRELGCEFVLCDISPLGIITAHQAGLPAILEENFTWDWIYAGYLHEEPRFAPLIEYLEGIFRSADIHIHTEPVCSFHLPADLLANVVGRKPRTACEETRALLRIDPNAQVVLLTMGGIGSQYPFLKQLQQIPDVTFLIPGSSQQLERRRNLVLLPHQSNLYHPDLVEASNAVIGKLGYSTLAEAYHTGIPYAYIPRPRFRESPAMSGFVLDNMNGVEISENRFFSGEWIEILPHLLAIPHHPPQKPNGADQIAQFLLH